LSVIILTFNSDNVQSFNSCYWHCNLVGLALVSIHVLNRQTSSHLYYSCINPILLIWTKSSFYRWTGAHFLNDYEPLVQGTPHLTSDMNQHHVLLPGKPHLTSDMNQHHVLLPGKPHLTSDMNQHHVLLAAGSSCSQTDLSPIEPVTTPQVRYYTISCYCTIIGSH